MNAVELIFDYFEDHIKAAQSVNQWRPVALGVLCFAISALSAFIADGLGDRLFPFSFDFVSLSIKILWEISCGFVLAGTLHLILEFGGVQGSAAALFVLLGMADLVWTLSVPAALIIKLAAPKSYLAPGIASFLIGLLALGLKARSLQDNYHISGSRAWVTISLPYLAMFFGALLVFAAAIWEALDHFLKS